MRTLFAGKKKHGPIEAKFNKFIRSVNKRIAKANFRNAKHRLAIFSFDHIGLMINQFGVYEGEELELVFDYLEPLHAEFKSRTALDIGANIGNHAVYFSDFFAKVHAFEPNPRTFELLCFNAKSVDNVCCHKFGLSDTSGSATLIQDDKNVGASFVGEVQDKAGKKAKAKRIELKPLDAVRDEFGDVALMKIDVEGMEMRVLKGATAFFESSRPLIFFEILETDFIDGNCKSVEFLKDLGYALCWIDKGEAATGSIVGAGMALLKGLFVRPLNRIVTAEMVPRRYHPFVIAVPAKFQEMLGIA
jgi:FkbM family methyltransferase